MEFFDVIQKRRSVRKFTQTPVPESVVRKAMSSAVLAPNSSNIQPWEFYWVRSPEKKQSLVKACFSQNAAATAQELIVCVSRIDTWKRNRDLILANQAKFGPVSKLVKDYYLKLVPLSYATDCLGILGLIKWVSMNFLGLFKPTPRKPCFRSDLFEVVTKSTALACENLMLSFTAQNFASCPMEGFDEVRVKSLLGLNYQAHVVMVIGIGEAHPSGVYGEQFRVNEDLVLKEV